MTELNNLFNRRFIVPEVLFISSAISEMGFRESLCKDLIISKSRLSKFMDLDLEVIYGSGILHCTPDNKQTLGD